MAGPEGAPGGGGTGAGTAAGPRPNRLYLGDNLAVMRSELAGGSVDLAYLDPPFNTRSVFRLRAGGGGAGPGKAGDTGCGAGRVVHPGGSGPKAFDDRWRWDAAARQACLDLGAGPPPVAELVSSLRRSLGEGNLLAYLALIGVRLLEVARVLGPRGSLYLHCDPRMSHYLRLLMDAVFGRGAFQNEIVWSYRSGGGSRRRFGRKHDVLLFYAPGPEFTFNPDAVRQPYDAVIAERRRKLFHPLGKVMGDVWDLPRPPNHSREWTGYPTQKPERLLERIIAASSNPGDLVLDPFCGSGTTLVVAGRLGRRWVGIDNAPLAVALAAGRLDVSTVPGAPGFEVVDLRRSESRP